MSRPADPLAPIHRCSMGMRPGERFNTCTHLLGFALAIPGVPLMLIVSLPTGDVGKIAGGLVFSLSCVALYAASTFFHSSHGAAKLWWQRADHCAIYLLIAGSYTPFALVAARGAWDWAVLVAVWIIALLGIARELGVVSPAPPLSLYMGMGWAMVAAAVPLLARIDAIALRWLLAGAVFYTVGTVFYVNRAGYRHAHGVWHLFVLGGTASHYAAVVSVVA
ncbi:hemolysin III family protein [Paracidovorax citrulli]|uniref:Hly-III family protein n=3 Tax=Paracidovorax citrulli TaxID=80869 RepID=A1TK59_PARC0|nr:Hly-III family protein [Paracidovorax citrulli AAC00-1]